MASRLPLVFLLFCTALPTSAAEPSSAPGEQVLSLEKQWASAIQRRDVAAMDQFLGANYFLAIGVQGESLQVIPRAAWLANLKDYDTKSFTIDDAQVHVYGDTAVVLMLYSQQASVRGQDRSAQFLLTDVWSKEKTGWHVVERHSSRPEPKPAPRPK